LSFRDEAEESALLLLVIPQQSGGICCSECLSCTGDIGESRFVDAMEPSKIVVILSAAKNPRISSLLLLLRVL
jgi:hypothetical protein